MYIISVLTFLTLLNVSFLQAYLVQILLQKLVFMVHLAVSQVWSYVFQVCIYITVIYKLELELYDHAKNDFAKAKKSM